MSESDERGENIAECKHKRYCTFMKRHGGYPKCFEKCTYYKYVGLI